MRGTLNMGIGVIFMVDAIVAYCAVSLKGDCLIMKAVEARRVDVKRVVRGWWRTRRGSINYKVACRFQMSFAHRPRSELPKKIKEKKINLMMLNDSKVNGQHFVVAFGTNV